MLERHAKVLASLSAKISQLFDVTGFIVVDY
jgi:hypothetical protein